ncbi:MAG TPA: DEAD/DEAH box helicase [Caulobacteraceae bacterium]
MRPFSELGLATPLLKTLTREGYETPTPIQAQAIPPVLAGKDLLGIAQTGTGKTAAFALPIMTRLLENKRQPSRRACRVLVLSPTRELTQQIAASFTTYGAGTGLTVAVMVGGVKYGGQIRSIAAGIDVLVATPGRLLDHLGQGTVKLDETEVFVLDEADQMLDLGFVEPIRKVVRRLPPKRQNLFFSATMPKTIGELANEILHNPQEVRVTPQATTVEKINQRVLHVEQAAKRDLLIDMLSEAHVKRALVFTRTKHGADKLTQALEKAGLTAAAIHGNKSQGQREKALAAFKAGKVQSLIATDIAARGIDVDAVTHVFQFELPNVPEAYVHRIGRTARAGAEGAAVAFCDKTERGLLRDIEKVTRQSIPAEDHRQDKSRPLTESTPEHVREAKKASRRRGRGTPVEHAHRPDAPAAKREHRKGQQRTEWSPVDADRARAPKSERAKAGERSQGGNYIERALSAQGGGGGYGARPAAKPAAGGGYGSRGPKRQGA